MDEMIYLDNASTTFPKPPDVYDFMHDLHMRHGAVPGRSGYREVLESEAMVLSTRKMLTEFFKGADPQRLTFSCNASDSLNTIINGVVKEGDHVVTTMLEHNSVIRPLNHKRRDGGVEVTMIPFDGEGYIDPDEIRKAFKSNTRLVIANHASNVIGTVQPVAEIGAVCREAGITFAVDGSQSAGVVAIDVEMMNIDLLAFTGHKSLMGPTGTGGLYCGEDVDIKASRYGGTGVQSASPYHLDEFPYRLECGTPNLLGVSGLHAAQKWLRKEGVENIHRREMGLLAKLREALLDTGGVITYCTGLSDHRIAVLSFNIEGLEPADTGTILDVKYNIATRTGLQCAPLVHRQLGTAETNGTVRVSLGPFNTDEHIDTLIGAVKDIVSGYGS